MKTATSTQNHVSLSFAVVGHFAPLRLREMLSAIELAVPGAPPENDNLAEAVLKVQFMIAPQTMVMPGSPLPPDDKVWLPLFITPSVVNFEA